MKKVIVKTLESALSIALCTLFLWYVVKMVLFTLLMVASNALNSAVEVRHYDFDNGICVTKMKTEMEAPSLVCE